MTSLSDLTPAERARLLGKPEGELGIALGQVMNQTNAKLIDTVYRRLRLQPRQSVLEIGFGNGHTVPLLIQQAGALTYTGIEIARTMVAEATAFNQVLIDAGQATFRLAPAEAMPFGDATFDAALAVNVIYFWRDAVRVLTEICRVLRPGGSVLSPAWIAPRLPRRRSIGRNLGFRSTKRANSPRCTARRGLLLSTSNHSTK